MPLTPFEHQYERLNDAQHLAVDTIDGPVMVMAGPGTGKTQVLALRIANILLKTDTQPHNILALTFTDAAAKNMRVRLSKLIGARAYQIEIKTFHAFCDDIIRLHPESFPIDRSSQPIDDVERYDILQTLLSNPDLKALRTPSSKFHYLRDVQSIIADLKKEGLTPSDFERIVQDEVTWFASEKDSLKKTEVAKWESLIPKHTEIALLYQQYQTYLREHHRYDFDDMIIETVQALGRDETLLLAIQEQYQYILVDEYQDTNSAQNSVVYHLSSYWGEDANVFVVGDPHQTIFRFQGASMENTIGFLTHFPKATCITLEVGYRCPQSIYTASHALIEHSPIETATTQLQSHNTLPGPITLLTAPTPLFELAAIAKRIQTLLTDGVIASEIAVLVRKNKQCDEVAAVFDAFGIPYETERGQDVLTSPLILQLLTLLRVINALPHATESSDLFSLLNSNWTGIDPLLIMQLTRATAKSKTHTSMYTLVKDGYAAVSKLKGCESITPLLFSTVETFFDQLVSWRQTIENDVAAAWLPRILQESGIMPWVIQQPHAQSLLCDLTAFCEHILRSERVSGKQSIDSILATLATMQEHGLTIQRGSEQTTQDRLSICTVHKAKGREWEQVFIPMLVDKNWGNPRSQSGIPLPDGVLTTPTIAHDINEDERRLLYVALTRAKHAVTLSYATSDTVSGKQKDLLPSQFIEELPSDLIQNEILTLTEDETAQIQTTILTPQPKRAWKDAQRSWLQEIVNNIDLSVSNLNTYLRSPQEFYERVLLRVPQVTESHLAYGTAIHHALELHFAHVKNNAGAHPPLDSTLQAFTTKLSEQPISPDDLSVRLRQGTTTLTAYLTAQQEKHVQVLTTEEGFGWSRGKIILGDVSLTGKIDRIDWLDQQEKTITIIDYKTGKPKTVGQIEGTTADSNLSERELVLPPSIRGPMKRQLLFYKLLLSLDRQYKHLSVASAQFEFVEPQKDTFITRPFTLSDSDVEDLKTLIQDVMQEIRSLKFLDLL